MSQAIEERLKNIESMLSILLGQKADPETEDLIDMEEAARLCDLKTGTLYNYKNKGKFRITFTKRGKDVLMKRRDVLQWNAERTFQMVPALRS